MDEIIETGKLYWNYILFCSLYSVAHGAVDAVLAYSTAELGNDIGSNGSTGLYVCYTISAFLFAKPILRLVGPRTSIFCGLCGMLLYVASFFMAIQIPRGANALFTIGGVFGGLGAGLLWPAQGAYFSACATNYAARTHKEVSFTIDHYASLFAGIYLGFEAIFKAFATVAYVVSGKESYWRLIVFGTYTAAAYCSVIAFGAFVSAVPRQDPLQEEASREPTSSINSDCSRRSPQAFRKVPLAQTADVNDVDTHQQDDDERHMESYGHRLAQLFPSLDLHDLRCDALSVIRAIRTDRVLQLIIPYQICFGFSAGFVGFYINKNVVAYYIGDGYIGLLTASSTLCAALLSFPFASLSRRNSGRGKWYVMVIGALCFCSSGLAPLVLTDSKLSTWPCIVVYFLLHGAARCCWESTNKAVIAEYFPLKDPRETAFAAVYFTSGLSGAIAYYFYKYMTRDQMVWTNTIVPLIALISYHFSDRIFHQSRGTVYDVVISTSSYGDTTSAIESDQQLRNTESATTAKRTIEAFEIE